MEAQEFAEKANEIFVLSDSFVRIKELIDDETSTIDDIADVILLDPALAGTVLKLANSSFFNYPGKIDTISKAVLVLGITEVYNLVIAYFTTEAFKSLDAESDYLDDFWERSVDCALLVKYIGSQLKILKAERLFILGLLHNLGELVVKQFEPEKLELCQTKNVNELPWDLQLQHLGFTFADCTSALLKLWQLPYSLVEPIRFQDESNFSLSTEETQLLYICKRIMMRNHYYENDGYDSLLGKQLIEELKLTPDLLGEAQNYCDMERFAILSTLKPSGMMIY